MYTKFWWKNLKGGDHAEDLGVDGDNIRIDLREIGWGGVDCIHLAQDPDQWWALVNKVMNELSGSIKGGEFLDHLSDY
jgi:hypothetical protein